MNFFSVVKFRHLCNKAAFMEKHFRRIHIENGAILTMLQNAIDLK
ncbi:MAG TPA: hypothetical protein VJ112_00420 [Rhabdochlamydiaceae bacterium]|nr:hypothetical protein [Rhabdochlamydiaceae bacterium]